MFKLILVTSEKEIKEFEDMRERVFNPESTVCHCSFMEAIKDGDMLAFQCMKEGKLVGGILLRLVGNNIKVSRLFVIKEERGNHAGSFMINFVESKKQFFEDHYGCSIKGIILEPLQSSVEYYYSKGYEYSGFQMYKRYPKKQK